MVGPDDMTVANELLSDLAAVQEEFGPSQALERLAGSIQRATESIGGSCERARPFASMFLVATADNSLVWRCSHNPPHPDLPYR